MAMMMRLRSNMIPKADMHIILNNAFLKFFVVIRVSMNVGIPMNMVNRTVISTSFIGLLSYLSMCKTRVTEVNKSPITRFAQKKAQLGKTSPQYISTVILYILHFIFNFLK